MRTDVGAKNNAKQISTANRDKWRPLADYRLERLELFAIDGIDVTCINVDAKHIKTSALETEAGAETESTKANNRKSLRL